ncbi:TCR/Tet family MFS transporter [Sulfitobacter donghicola]|uniref:MFS transporter n=1 Tax=Sulfitobacter donghicola DSW-25 = KCTC 12864 = JCM 14565 TaxID=1300350 RepID=A0A073IED0_9RHOB|nr:tetracycline resistance MFS efflux pump [Sulfitobacter donghicola]KEJ88069.1 MFS transporter [Sulfitobacter donghicola DSW-25 = KCTC 12864 = JCM 14565]KIN68712.1 Tetracycline resistance protein [Sulfitobacter donghicola DSW-25 = KCTC 12864 = JCM 14565]
MNLPIIFILLTVMIDAMGIGLIIPVMPDLIQELSGGTLAQAAIWGGILSTVFAVMQFLFGPVIGGLSDRYGRRPVLLIALTVMALDYVLMAVAGVIWLLLIGRVIGGITAATQSTASAYMADISSPSERAARFGLIGAAFGAGFVLGPLLGGLLAEYGTRAPFWVAAALAGANAVFGWVVLTETVTDATRRPFSWRRANPLGALRALGRLPGLLQLLLVYFIYHVGFSVYPAVWSYFTKERFDWPPAMIGLSLGLFGVSMALVQAGLIRPFLAKLGERGTVILGHLFSVTALITIATMTSGFWVIALTPLAALGGIIPPALQGIMSARVAEDAQGELQGALTSASALAMIISPLLMTYTFAQFTDANAPVYLPGAPFLLAAVLSGVGLIVVLASRRKSE